MPNLQKFPSIKARAQPLRRAREHQHACAGINEGHVFTVPLFLLLRVAIFLSPEGRDSSASEEISCVIEQHCKETLLSTAWQSLTEQLKKAEACNPGLCMCCRRWKVAKGTITNKFLLDTSRNTKIQASRELQILCLVHKIDSFT